MSTITNLQMIQNTRGRWFSINKNKGKRDMATASISGRMGLCTKENGRIIRLMGRVRFGIAVVIYIKGSF